MSDTGNIRRPVANVFVATTVMLAFISFWQAAAIVLSDLASSAYYAGGEAEHYIGKSAPWFILAVMLFSYAVRALYIESSAMFVRGGVYRVVSAARRVLQRTCPASPNSTSARLLSCGAVFISCKRTAISSGERAFTGGRLSRAPGRLHGSRI